MKVFWFDCMKGNGTTKWSHLEWYWHPPVPVCFSWFSGFTSPSTWNILHVLSNWNEYGEINHKLCVCRHETNYFNTPLSLVPVPGLDPVPLQFAPQLDHLAPGGAQPHKPLSRTRSEPLPQSPRALHTHLLQQQHNTQLLERLKQQTHLGKVWRSEDTHSSSHKNDKGRKS